MSGRSWNLQTRFKNQNKSSCCPQAKHSLGWSRSLTMGEDHAIGGKCAGNGVVCMLLASYAFLGWGIKRYESAKYNDNIKTSSRVFSGLTMLHILTREIFWMLALFRSCSEPLSPIGEASDDLLINAFGLFPQAMMLSLFSVCLHTFSKLNWKVTNLYPVLYKAMIVWMVTFNILAYVLMVVTLLYTGFPKAADVDVLQLIFFMVANFLMALCLLAHSLALSNQFPLTMKSIIHASVACCFAISSRPLFVLLFHLAKSDYWHNYIFIASYAVGEMLPLSVMAYVQHTTNQIVQVEASFVNTDASTGPKESLYGRLTLRQEAEKGDGSTNNIQTYSSVSSVSTNQAALTPTGRLSPTGSMIRKINQIQHLPGQSTISINASNDSIDNTSNSTMDGPGITTNNDFPSFKKFKNFAINKLSFGKGNKFSEALDPRLTFSTTDAY
eukprot:g35603.t1